MSYSLLLKFFLLFGFLFIPSAAYAWGPLTHIYLANEVLSSLAPMLPVSVYALLRKYRQDFLYGNLMADVVLGKKHVPLEHHPHNWNTATELLKSARTEHERAFCLGYMSHLAADTVAHGQYTAGLSNLSHATLEFQADSLIDHDHWFHALSINSEVTQRNDSFISDKLRCAMFSFKTNRNVFHGWVAFSGLGSAGRAIGNFAGLARSPISDELELMHAQSLERIICILNDPLNSEVLTRDAIGDLKPGWLMRTILS
jgi:hypothetical protein